jgi:hypothetical protein
VKIRKPAACKEDFFLLSPQRKLTEARYRMPQLAKTEATSDGFSAHEALKHVSSSSPPLASSAVATTATPHRNSEPLAQSNTHEPEPLATRSSPPRHLVRKKRGG